MLWARQSTGGIRKSNGPVRIRTTVFSKKTAARPGFGVPLTVGIYRGAEVGPEPDFFEAPNAFRQNALRGWGAPHDLVILRENKKIADLLFQNRECALSGPRIRDERYKYIFVK